MDRSPSVRILDRAGHSVFIVASRLNDHNIGYLYELHGTKLVNSNNWQIKTAPRDIHGVQQQDRWLLLHVLAKLHPDRCDLLAAQLNELRVVVQVERGVLVEAAVEQPEIVEVADAVQGFGIRIREVY